MAKTYDKLLELVLEHTNKTKGTSHFKRERSKRSSMINYISEFSIDGCKVTLGNYKELSDDELELQYNHLVKDFPAFKTEYKKLLQGCFEKKVKAAQDWDMDVENADDLIKMAGNPGTISYMYYDKSSEANFQIWFNSKAPYNNDFFGGHSLVIDVTMENGKISGSSSSLEG